MVPLQGNGMRLLTLTNTKFCSLANGYRWQQNTVWMWKTGIMYVACSYHACLSGAHHGNEMVSDQL